MKKIIKICLLILTVFISTKVYAASVSISASKQNVYVGDSVNVTVTVYAGTWNLRVSGPGANDSIVGYDMDGNKTTTKTYKVDTSSVGAKTIVLTGDITDYDTDVTTRNINKSVTINVSQVPATQAPVTQPPVATTTTVKKTTKATTKPVATTTVVTTTEQQTTVPAPTKIEISEFKIVGYNIDFNSDQKEYTIDVSETVDELYVIVNGNDIEVLNSGVVNIKDKESIDITVKKDNQEVVYKIYLERGSVKGVSTTKESINDKLILTIIILSIVVIGLIVFMLYYLLSIKKSV